MAAELPPAPTHPHPQLILIAAMDENRLLADANGIPWHQPRDVSHFRAHTKDQWLLLGKRTYLEMQGWFQAGHRPVVLSSSPTWKTQHATVVSSIENALRHFRLCDPQATKIYCCGGAHTYATALPYAHQMILTLLHHRHPATAQASYFPNWNREEWHTIHKEHHPADAANPYAMDILTLQRCRSANRTE